MVRTIKKHNKDKNKKTRRRYKQKTFKKRDRYRNNRKRKTYRNNRTRKTYRNNRTRKTYRNNRKRKTYRNNRRRKTYSNNRKIKTYHKNKKRYVSKLFKLYKGGSLPWSSDLQDLTDTNTLTNICRRPDNRGKSLVFIYNDINHIMVKHVEGIRKNGKPLIKTDMLPIEVKCYWRSDTSRSQIFPYREFSRAPWRPRHHCRVCGRVIGGDSMKENFQLLDGTRNIEKICFECYAVLYKEREDERIREYGAVAAAEPETFRCVDEGTHDARCVQLTADEEAHTDLPKCIKNGDDYVCPGQVGITSLPTQAMPTFLQGVGSGIPAESSAESSAVDTGFTLSELPNELSYRNSDSRTWRNKTHMETFGSRTKLDLSPLILPGLIIKQSNKGYIILSIDDSYWYVLCIHSRVREEIGKVHQLGNDSEFNQTYLYRPCWNHVRVLHECFKYKGKGKTVVQQNYITDPLSLFNALESDTKIMEQINANYQFYLANTEEDFDIEKFLEKPMETIKASLDQPDVTTGDTTAPPSKLQQAKVQGSSGLTYRDELDNQSRQKYGISLRECITGHNRYIDYLKNIQKNLWFAFCYLLPMITTDINVEILDKDGVIMAHSTGLKEQLIEELTRLVPSTRVARVLLREATTLKNILLQNSPIPHAESLLHISCTIDGHELEFKFLLSYIQENKDECLKLIQAGIDGALKNMIR